MLRLVELHYIYGRKLSLTATLPLFAATTPTSWCWPAPVPLSTRKPPLAFSGSSRPVRCTHSSGRRELSASSFLPPNRGSNRLHPKPTALTPPQAPMVGATLHLLHCGRLTTAYVNSALSTARRGRQTLKPQADFRDCLSLRCTSRHPSVL